MQIQAIKDKLEKKKNIIEYGHLIPENKVNKIKEEINQIVSDNSKPKSKINFTTHSRIDDEQEL